jgi:biotin synthase
MFVGDYLTTQGQLPDDDYKMIAEMGFVITRGQESDALPTPSTL